MSSRRSQSTTRIPVEAEMIDELRRLRGITRRLNSSLVEHLKPFQQEDGSFKTWPDSQRDPHAPGHPDIPDISVASTSTALMALIAAGRQDELFSKADEDKKEKEDRTTKKKTLAAVFKNCVRGKWGSSGLKDGNAFTTAMLVRCAGIVVNAKVKDEADKLLDLTAASALVHPKYDNDQVADKTLKQIIDEKASSAPEAFRVEEYPAKTTLAYWFVDGIIKSKIGADNSTWEKIALWASRKFHEELSYVAARNDSLMDPPSLAMAACLISRLRPLCAERPELATVKSELPSLVELDFGIEQVFSQQAESGIWPKYFPLFHFPGGKGAADYCFSFEFLEAVLIEFGTSVLSKPSLIQKIERAVRWCDTHFLEFKHSGDTYRGWNSGGEVSNLAAGKPESWATASVHMFLTQLDRRISDLLDQLVLKARFKLDRRAVVESPNKFNDLIDINLSFPDEPPTTLKTVVKEEILQNAQQFSPEALIEFGLSVPRSALLFGPPGTSKTYLARAIAEYLGWPLVVVTPSEFLGKGLEQVHAQVDEVFRDLMDLRQVVVFFDEMDALAQTREGEDSAEDGKRPLNRLLRSLTRTGKGSGDLDVTRQLLTTSMLPKLANLWDRKRVIFLMATNHKQQLDPAITRPNRFDLLLCVAPAPWAGKSDAAKLKGVLAVPQSDEVKEELIRLAPIGSPAGKLFDSFTVSELGIFLDHLRRRRNSASILEALKEFKDEADFAPIVAGWAETSITLRGRRTREEFDKDLKESRRQYYPGQK